MSLPLDQQFYEHAVEAMPTYKGLPMICVGGLHEMMADLARAQLSAGARVLDVGCGRGAFSLRLADLGFDVDACDLRDLCMCRDRVRFMLGAAEAIEPETRYDAIFMLELLEHVESPFEVIRRYTHFLRPGGRLYISTPNVDSDLSRAWFLLTGDHWYFERRHQLADGHITPIHDFQLEHFAERSPLEIVSRLEGPDGRAVRPGLLWLLWHGSRLRRWLSGRALQGGATRITVFRLPDDDG